MPKLIIRAINFELVQLICSRYLNVADRQTDGRLTIAMPRFSLRASCGKKNLLNVYNLTVYSSSLDQRDAGLVR